MESTTGILYCGNVLEELQRVASESVQMCVTSPPYWGLRDYGTPGQLGLEETPEEYVSNLVKVFREARRVLRMDGTFWLNIGDCYYGSGGFHGTSKNPMTDGLHKTLIMQGAGGIPKNKKHARLKPKDLVGIPWMLAFALRDDGWYLRQDIIWAKPNCMPESVKDRCTKSHEYLFLLSKSNKYYYDIDSIREPLKESSIRRYKTGWSGNEYRDYPGENKHNNISKYYEKMNKIYGEQGSWHSHEATLIKGNKPDSNYPRGTHPNGKNKRSVWSIAPKPFKDAHFAVFPEDLVHPCILAGCPKNGIVLDPFIGSGTTAIVAEKLNRNWIGIDINESYCEMAALRILSAKEENNK